MKKILTIGLSITASVIVAVCIGLGLVFTGANKTTTVVANTPIADSIPFKIGLTTRSGTFSNGDFVYEDSSNGNGLAFSDVSYNINEYDALVLNNDSYKSGNQTYGINNLYVQFGSDDDDASVKLINTLAVSVEVNGVTKSTSGYDYEIYSSGLTTKACYYYAYFDAIDFGTGLYTFTFSYSYTNGSNITSSYSVYLIDETDYKFAYPTIYDAEEGLVDQNNISQYFYNYQSNTLPSLTYNPSLIQLSYTMDKAGNDKTVVTNFNQSSKELSVTTNSTDTQTYTTDESGNVTLTFSELGTYNFEFAYIVFDGSDYVEITNVKPHNISNTTIASGQLKLHNYGTELFYTSNSQSTWFASVDGNTITSAANATSAIIDYATQTDASYNIAHYATNSLDSSFYSTYNYPSTNKTSITIEYHSTFTYLGYQPSSTYRLYSDSALTTLTESGYVTKDTRFDKPGYYEIIVNYTYDSLSTSDKTSSTNQAQVFLFQIENSAPTVSIKNQYGATVANGSFVNEPLSFNWQEASEFSYAITAEYTYTSFDGRVQTTTEFTNGDFFGYLDGAYVVRIYFTSSRNIYVEYSFNYDATPISNIEFFAINSSTIAGITTYSLVDDSSIVDFNGQVNFDTDNTTELSGRDIITNQPFTLTFDSKESGATITTTYTKIPFTANSTAGQVVSIAGNSNIMLIQTDYLINPDSAISGIYNADYTTVLSKVVPSQNVFIDSQSAIYFFEMTDQAGNTASTYLIYDLTKPYVLIDTNIDTPDEYEPINNSYGIVTDQAEIIFGTHKAIKVDNLFLSNTFTNTLLDSLYQANTSLFYSSGTTAYLSLPLNEVTIKEINESNSITTSDSSVMIYPEEPQDATVNQSYLSGDNRTYIYTVSDMSNITSTTLIANSNTTSGFVNMNLDTSLAMVFGDFGSNSLESLLGPYTTTSANSIRFTYNQADQTSPYYVKSAGYTYYDYDNTSYKNISNLTATTPTIADNEKPTSHYPYSSYGTYTNLTIDSNTSIYGDDERVVSTVINPTTVNGVTVTKPGMYIFERSYDDTNLDDGEDYGYDTQTKYYVVYVDRSDIISITETDAHIYNEVSSNSNYQDDILYDNGSGILFNFSSSSSTSDTYYTAKQIQTHLASLSASISLFDSNKLPITNILPNDKYNTNFVLNQATGSNLDYVDQLTTNNQNYFALYTSITCDNMVVYNTKTGVFNSNYIGLTSGTQNSQLLFKQAGTYTITLFDNADGRRDYITETDYTKLSSNNISFQIQVTHNAPDGGYYTQEQGQDISVELYDTYFTSSSNGDIQTSVYSSTNTETLKFIIPKSTDIYKADIDLDYIMFGSSSTSTTNITQNRLSSSLLEEVVSNGQTFYHLTIYDETVYDFNNSDTYYLGGSGANRDYLLSQTSNITYYITLQYQGTQSDYIYTDSFGNKTNYFTQSFQILLDRTRPTYNFAQLTVLDSQKIDIANTPELSSYQEQYFYAMGSGFTFEQNQAAGGVNDSNELFIRRLGSTYPTDYIRTRTPDDEDYNDAGSFIKFTDVNTNFTKFTYTDGVINADDMFGSDLLVGDNYYEVVERDMAGNYNVYAVYYQPNTNEPQISFVHNTTESFTLSNNDINVFAGTDILLSTIISNDQMLKAIISYNGAQIVVVNTPTTQSDLSFYTFINNINNEINYIVSGKSDDGYYIEVEFINRIGNNLSLQYSYAGIELVPTFTNGPSTFSLTIPSSSLSTYITMLSVEKLDNSSWVSIVQDSSNKLLPIVPVEINYFQGVSYNFSTGSYRFTLTDNFGRTSIHYYSFGSNTYNNIVYSGNTETVTDNDEQIVVTSNSLYVEYNTSSLAIKIYEYDFDANAYVIFLDTADSSLDTLNHANVTFTSGTFGKLNFTVTDGNYARFKVEIVVQDAVINTYNFEINKTLPEIVLKNLSGGIITNVSKDESNPDSFIDEFFITWTDGIVGNVINLTRQYFDDNGINQTEEYKNIANGYKVVDAGRYTAVIYNTLGYTNSLNTLYFTLIEGQIIVYEIVTTTNNKESYLQASTKIKALETIDTDTEQQKVVNVYVYYALDTFDISSDNYVSGNSLEIRTNTNNSITYDENIVYIGDTIDSSYSYKNYRIYSQSSYGYQSYIQIIFVPTSNDFASVQTTTTSNGVNSTSTVTTNTLSMVDETVTIKWNTSYFDSYNFVSILYYFNGEFVSSISTGSFSISTAGIHLFQFVDLAGNIHQFSNEDYLTINLVNDILFTVNGSDPLNNQIFNGDVTITLTNTHLYNSKPLMSASKNNVELNLLADGYYTNTTYLSALFTEHGTYTITLTGYAYVKTAGSNSTTDVALITTTYSFQIIDTSIALYYFGVSQTLGFYVEKILNQNIDVTDANNRSEIWLDASSTADGPGIYTITLSKYIAERFETVTFTFQVWLNNEIPTLISSIPFGTGSTKTFTITFNPSIIYDQIGKSYISITGMSRYDIDENSENTPITITLGSGVNEDYTYWIKIFSQDGREIVSYKLIKEKPMSSIAVLVIIICVAVAICLTVTFIIIRRHLKFR